jgi:hypothetical protein
MIRKILVLSCDHCGKQEPTECQTIAEVKNVARELGWKVTANVAYCNYCRFLKGERYHPSD